MSRPVIAVTTSRRSGWRIFPLVALNVWIGGGRAVRWGAGRPSDLDTVSGVIVGGGDDIAPDLYGGAPVTKARLDPDRDALERQIVEACLSRGIPLLGICRGSQMLNVALGGTLDQDAYATFTRSKKVYTILPKKDVRVESNTRLQEITGTAPMKVNALHSQAVDRLGQGLRVAARDTGGMIQGVERIADPFALGVQWHPEHLFYAHRQRAIFRALVTAAKARDDGRAQNPDVSADAAYS
ncbi:gamma-glutamyl-gamma-aminobutyrate hydrolase family protein [Pelagovum pacificum]|uniref:Gamma-glutamyl-gamma-aminobutyrate hydrolase family protein n=1 Tax=Pelagovum pacificum TaxID=2588711 RepID=A0A5C5GBT6_9RHOB|nr:gamma-glutamyl-gamma-aminobutyrate hydrolase family protein [Pelagovum pacificum]QQA42483.1 gamma-glutamyl-gamma-aminobutyrate hydrolase family protein [Pelagovum pacificum]TNY31567.1 gamma-glutamyl-gamma-aminobutyrate hydrolase family protein [Pelagovum pacificum]